MDKTSTVDHFVATTLDQDLHLLEIDQNVEDAEVQEVDVEETVVEEVAVEASLTAEDVEEEEGSPTVEVDVADQEAEHLSPESVPSSNSLSFALILSK